MKRDVVLICFVLIWSVAMSAQAQQTPTKTVVRESAADIERERTPQITTLYELVRSADKIVVTSDSENGSKVLFESSNPVDLIAFRNALKLIAPDYWTLSVCSEPNISLYRSGKEIVTIGNVLGNAVKSSVWSGNALIADSEKWFMWFDTRGMPQVRNEYNDSVAANKRHEEEEARWYSAMPRRLKDSYDKQRYRIGIPGRYELEQMNAVLEKEYPNKNDRILSLLHWYGSGSESWSSAYDYEVIAEKLLFEYGTAEIVRSLEIEIPTERQLEGAARLFAGWDFYKMRPNDFSLVSKALKKRLIDHALRSKDKDKIERMRAAFEVK